MSYAPVCIPFASRVIITVLSFTLWLVASTLVGQTQQSSEIRELPPSQTIERDMVGAETHRYKISLQKDEFFQVRIEQKGSDVALKLLEENGNVLSAMDSPNGKEGYEILTFVAAEAGSYELEVKGFDATAEKGSYTIRREASRMATAQDRQRVEVERLFVEGVTALAAAGQAETGIKKLEESLSNWQVLQDDYMTRMTAGALKKIKEAQKLQGIPPLPVNEPVEHQLKGGENHLYAVYLKVGAVLRLEAQEKGLNLMLGVMKVIDSQLVASADFGFGNDRECLTFISKEEAAYVAGVAGVKSSEETVSGGYKLVARVSETASAADEDRIKAESLLKEGLIARNQNNEAGMRKAIGDWEAALTVWKKLEEDFWAGYTSQLIGVGYDALGEKAKAIESYNRALPPFQAIGDHMREAFMLKSISDAYLSLGEKRKAAESLDQLALLWKREKNLTREVLTYGEIAKIYQEMGEAEQAIESYKKTLPIYRELKLAPSEIVIYGVIASLYNALGRYDEVIKYSEMSLAIEGTWPEGTTESQKNEHENMVKSSKALSQQAIGAAYMHKREWEKALRYLNQALPFFENNPDKELKMMASTTLTLIGQVYFFQYEWEKALASYKRSLSIAEQTDNKSGIPMALLQIGVVYVSTSDNRKAISYFEQAIETNRAFRERGFLEKKLEAAALNNMGSAYGDLGEMRKANEYHNQALTIQKELNDPDFKNNLLATNKDIAVVYRELGDTSDDMSTTYNNIASEYAMLEDNKKALDYLNLALDTFRQSPPVMKNLARNQATEARYLTNMATIYSRLGRHKEALKYCNQALEIAVRIDSKMAKAAALNQIGITYGSMGDTLTALKYLNDSLLLNRQVGDKKEEAGILSGLGYLYDILGEKQKALEYHELSLSLARKIGNKALEVSALNNKGAVYSDLGEGKLALEYINASLLLARDIGVKGQEAFVLNNTSGVYQKQGDNETALKKYKEAAALFHDMENKRAEAIALGNVGNIYLLLNEPETALKYLKESLRLTGSVEDKQQEAITLAHSGRAYAKLGEKNIAIDYFSKSLLLLRMVGDKNQEARTLKHLMSFWKGLNNRRLAIFFGKQSVNRRQGLRQVIRGLDNETQKSFLRGIRDSYQELAETLIEDGQLAQAVQVLNLYQDQQFFDFNRDPREAVKQLLLSPRETAPALRYEQAGERVGQVSEQIEDLKGRIGNRQPNEQEVAQRDKLDAEFKTASDAFLAVLKDAETEFSNPQDQQDDVPVAKDVTDMQDALYQISEATGQKTAALYTLVGEENFRVLLVRPGDIKSFASPIKSKDFDEKVKEFYAVLRSPDYDPRLLGKQLYDIILKPAEAELKQMGARTLLWSLDGTLRYVPMAALSPDGAGYLIEQYQNVVFTRADSKRMTGAVSKSWTGTGFGSSKARTVELLGKLFTFSELPGVTAELRAIFSNKQNASGILNGAVFANDNFTKAAFYKAMMARRPLVHISSHFSFRPGDESLSFLLLGDGTTLTLNELKKKERLFDRVELLTLSACNTAAKQADDGGREIDGFAELAQRLGAGAVMATLWRVSDNSTPRLMSRFYRLRQEPRGRTKAEALREAQLALLNGIMRVKAAPGALKGSPDEEVNIVLVPPGGNRDGGLGRDTDIIYVDQINAPPYRKDAAKAYAHPYYWAPFVLFGNWQ